MKQHTPALETLLKKSVLLIFVFVAVLYFASHLANFSTAPWNQNGLFDDAAWDIYFAKNHVFNGIPFQAAYFDSVGNISREVIFHYYISVFFRLFGYNLLVFNISLLILGFVTILFTTLIVYKLFNNILVTTLSALIINFFPLHFMHVFVGHRYAIAVPLMVVSLYYLYTSFKEKSYWGASISGIFAALCLGSTIMGKQYIYGLILSAICVLLNKNTLRKSKEKLTLAIVWITGFILAASPLIIYIIFNSSVYNIREGNLIREFFEKYHQGGLIALQPYFDQIKEVFFADHTYRRWFLPDFHLIPFPYYVLIIPGLIIAWLKKRFEIVFLAIIPVAGAFVAGSYDFRVLLAAPIWIISIAFSLDFLNNLRVKPLRHMAFLFGLVAITLGLYPSIKYIWAASKNPNFFYLLPHKDVAVSRLVQDIVLGVKNPTDKMKWDELNRPANFSLINSDTFVCPTGAYAIMHLFLQNYNDKKILSFIDQGTQQLATPTEILNYNVEAIKNYIPTNRDLKMVWEISDKTNDIIKIFSKYNKYGSDEVLSDSVDGTHFSLYVLTIKNEYLGQFKKDINHDSQKYPQAAGPI